ncbi:MAG: proline--tRNA ligase [Rhodocyclaceae bacterium]|jgi:prolyl-tRNA synthetase|nr:proline--tRNA ligase [Rhodocyclaceae bacterium]MCA3017135.1 proline--tRNA ligase [Rhodocyclaceae bacterium]MCA3023281.1 proline--tRNA ligase [Rhodocyclaceae bacterium]MCA3024078.1 proline--tRNA ligase [Rhodocyclaceae bacterium]MCA3029991.1 proline--tRNA ligase [Rhodocyclaceae bacterium]
MRASTFFISTLKEAPADADVISQKLMLRAGMIKKLAAGIYNYMPMGLRVIKKVERVVREEMERAGAIELLTPFVQPAELWMESGRWDKMGPEMLRIKDRHERDFILQPTSEEVLADIFRQDIRSYRQLPINFYQIQTKFRDERRPRFGVMRGREFTMKDAYSFDRDAEGARKSYDAMYDAYVRVFNRLGLTFRPVEADTGNIGGERSHEFQVIADTGEDALVYCPTSDYAANMEKAECVALNVTRAEPTQPMVKTPTPGKTKCEDVATLLNIPLADTVKSIVLATEKRDEKGNVVATTIWLLLIRGDHELNEVKANKINGLNAGFRFASEAEIESSFGCKPGYLGPVGLSGVIVVADRSVANMSDFVTGANTVDFHFTGVNWGRDLPEPAVVADIRNAVEGDPSPDGKGVLAIQRGIEVGHVFSGLPYPAKMGITFLGENGKPQTPLMGSYGIGITRVVAAAIEQNHDARGIIWPTAMAPFSVVVAPIGYAKSETVRAAADSIYNQLLSRGIDVLIDDRDERPGVMLADLELIGIPHRVVIGERSLKEGNVEYQQRRDAEPRMVKVAEVVDQLAVKLRPLET